MSSPSCLLAHGDLFSLLLYAGLFKCVTRCLIWKRSRLLVFPTFPHEQALVNSSKENLAFKGRKPRAELCPQKHCFLKPVCFCTLLQNASNRTMLWMSILHWALLNRYILNVLNNVSNGGEMGRCLAQLVDQAAHVQRLCPHCGGTRFESRPGALCHVSLPLFWFLFTVVPSAVGAVIMEEKWKLLISEYPQLTRNNLMNPHGMMGPSSLHTSISPSSIARATARTLIYNSFI